jgi:hypothetical protein
MKLMYRVIREMQQYQKMEYDFGKVESIQKFIKDILKNHVPMSDAEAYEQSLKIEPRDSQVTFVIN